MQRHSVPSPRAPRHRRLVSLTLLACCLVAACAQPPAGGPAGGARAAGQGNALPAPEGAGAPQTTAAPQKLTLMGSNVTYAQFAFPLAKEAGLFAKQGLDVEVAFSPRTIAALLSGDVQIATGAEDVVVANLGGADLIIIAVMVPVIQHRLMVRPEIRSMADLRDKPVSVSKRGNLPHTVIRLAAKRAGMDADRDLTIIEMGDTGTQVAALVSGTIYGVALVPPATDIVVERAGAYALYDARPEGIEYAVASVATSREWAARNEGAVLGVLRALAEAVHLMHTQPQYAADVYAQWSKTEEDAGRTAVALAREIVPLKMLPTAEGIGRVLETVADQLPAAATADPARFFDDRYIRKLEAEGFYERLGVR